MVERRAHNPEVTGSTPVPATTPDKIAGSAFEAHAPVWGCELETSPRQGSHGFQGFQRQLKLARSIAGLKRKKKKWHEEHELTQT